MADCLDTQTREDSRVFVRPGEIAEKLSDRQEFYETTHRDRGIAIILSQEKFTVKSLQGLPARISAKADRDSLRKVLGGMGFEVHEHNDLDCETILEVLSEAAKYDHSNSDCFVLVALSHGDENLIFAKDKGYHPEVLWESFYGDKCKSLVGKPKLFFIQTCRGFRVDDGVEIRQRTETDSRVHSYWIPNSADILLACSTEPGYLSWTSSEGSWFIQALCELLAKYKYQKDLMHILTLVHQKIAFHHQSNTPDDDETHDKKQMPHFVSKLTRLVAFKPKKLNS